MKIAQLVTQVGADLFQSVAYDTGLTADGKAGWSITSIQAYWVDATLVAAADWSINAKVATVSTNTDFGNADEFGRVAWGLQNTGGVAVAVPFEPVKQVILFEPRLTVQPQIYFQVTSALTGQANDVIIALTYDIVKLTDIEVLRLLAGGA